MPDGAVSGAWWLGCGRTAVRRADDRHGAGAGAGLSLRHRGARHPYPGVYNHRLYAHYGTARFIDLARRLTTEAPVWLRVMDPFGTRRIERTALDDSPERDRDELAALPDVEIISDRSNRMPVSALTRLAAGH